MENLLHLVQEYKNLQINEYPEQEALVVTFPFEYIVMLCL